MFRRCITISQTSKKKNNKKKPKTKQNRGDIKNALNDCICLYSILITLEFENHALNRYITSFPENVEYRPA